MSHVLFLLRHAKSDWKQEATSGNTATAVNADFERPLSKRGLNDAPRMAEWLARQANKPAAMISSPAFRAYQTALIFAHALNIPPKAIHFNNRIYEASLDTLLEIIRNLPEQEKSVLLVGHNPGLDSLVQALCKQVKPGSDGKLMTTCAVAEVAIESRWQDISAKQGKLTRLSRPGEID